MRKVFLLIAMLAGMTAQAAETTASISIDSRVRYQHVAGFGGFSPSPTRQYWGLSLHLVDSAKFY